MLKPRWRFPPLLRRLLPWAVGLGILAIVATRVPYASFRQALGQGPHVTLALFDLLIVSLVLASDSVSTWLGLKTLRMQRPLGQVLVVRGATNVLLLVNYALGQGGFGYYLNRSGTSGLRSVGATLYLTGTNLASLLVTASVALWAQGVAPDHGLRWLLIVGWLGLGGYLAVIAVAQRVQRRREVLAPLFDAGVRGHLLAILGRVPHSVVMVIGHWAALRVWGIEAPLSVGLTLMPLVLIASVLPISPAGLGTTQAAFVYFFGAYATGASEAERTANILTFGIVHFVYGIGASVILGLACTSIARRIGLLPPSMRPRPSAVGPDEA